MGKKSKDYSKLHASKGKREKQVRYGPGMGAITPGRWESANPPGQMAPTQGEQIEPTPREPSGEVVPLRTVLKTVPSGEIAMEVGGDGVYLRFDCDCEDALPYCKAACCALAGTTVSPSEAAAFGPDFVTQFHGGGDIIMARRSDAYCRQNDPATRLCLIYPDRPYTCQQFHCSRGPDTRGWQLRLNRIDL